MPFYFLLFRSTIFDNDTVSAFSNSAIFVVAIMLSGVLEDYKESEGFPAEIAAQFDSIAEKYDLCALLADLDAADDAAEAEAEGGAAESAASPADGESAAGSVSERDVAAVAAALQRRRRGRLASIASSLAPPPRRLDIFALNRELLALLNDVFCFLAGLSDDTEMLASLDTHCKYAVASVHRARSPISASDVLGHFETLRATILRMHVIKRTDFIPSGYSLMELLVWITMGLTVMADFDNQLTAYFTVAFTALQFFYVIALLRDIDDPCVCGGRPSWWIAVAVAAAAVAAAAASGRVASLFVSPCRLPPPLPDSSLLQLRLRARDTVARGSVQGRQQWRW